MILGHRAVTWAWNTRAFTNHHLPRVSTATLLAVAPRRYQSQACSTRCHPSSRRAVDRARRLDTSELCRAGPSRNVGNMDATAGSFRPLATCCDTSARSRARRPRRRVPTAAPSSRERLPGTATCYTTSASREETPRRLGHELFSSDACLTFTNHLR